MKATKIALLVLVLIAVAYIMLGWFLPSIEFTTEVTVDRPPSVAFTVMTDVDRLDEWVPGFQRVKIITQSDDWVGNRYVVRRVDESGRILETNIEVTAWEPNRVYGYSRRTRRSTTESVITFVAVDGGTKISADTRVTGNTWYIRSLLALTRNSTISDMQEAYANLSSVIDRAGPVLPGQWHGTDSRRAEHLFTFYHDGTAEWKVTSNQGVMSVSDIVWSIDRIADPIHLDLSGFSSGPLAGRVLYGILEFKSDSVMRYDANSGSKTDSSSRPDSFTDSSVTYRRLK